MEVPEGHVVFGRDSQGNPIASISKAFLIFIGVGIILGTVLLFWLGGDI